MPELKIPLSKGARTELVGADYVDALPVNMLAVPRPDFPESDGYMRSWPGLDQTHTVAGTARGAIYNVITNSVFRVQGNRLIEHLPNGTVADRAEVPGSGHVPMAYLRVNERDSRLAFVANGVLYFWDGTTRTQLQNWAEGERGTTTPNPVYALDYNGTSTNVAFQPLIVEPGGQLTFRATVVVEDNQTEQTLISTDSSSTARTALIIKNGNLVIARGITETVVDTIGTGIQEVNVEIINSLTSQAVFGLLGATAPTGGSPTWFLNAQMYNIRAFTAGDNRVFDSQITTAVDDPAPTTDILADSSGNSADGVITDGTWVLRDPQPQPEELPGTDYDLSDIIDVTVNKQRFGWIQRNRQTFGVTDLQNSQRPDYQAAFYSAETFPDDASNIERWQDYISVMGRYTTEFFRLTSNAANVYAQIEAYTTQCGALSAKSACRYNDAFVVIGGPQDKPVSIYLIAPGQRPQEIASRRIQKYLKTYTQEQLADVLVEPCKFEAIDGILVHLPDVTLRWNPALQGAEWGILKSDIKGDRPYRGIYLCHHDGINEWTAGDKYANILTEFNFASGAHVGEAVEYILDTMIVRARDAILYDLELETVSGRTIQVERIAVSITYDGITYGQEEWIEWNRPLDYTDQIILRNLGRIQNRFGIRLRWATTNSTTVGDLRVRAE